MAQNSIEESQGDVWYVYDGECPLCRTAAKTLRIRGSVGNLHLLNARTEGQHPVLQEIRTQGIDIDKGTVMKFGGRFYHGADAMTLMALLGSNVGWFNKMNAQLFRSPAVARFAYPVIRAGRNILLALKNVGQLHNLRTPDLSQPIFQPIFGNAWEQLPPVMHKHYANRPYGRDKVTAVGVMKVEMAPFMRLIAPFMKFTGVLVPYVGEDIATTVHFESSEKDESFNFNRIFHFPGKPPYHFRSRMVPAENNEVIEWTAIGIGWNPRFYYDGSKVRMEHRRYVIRLFGKLIPLPLEYLMGRGNAWEEAIDENRFRMMMEMHHPLFGRLYSYSGEFTITEMALDR